MSKRLRFVEVPKKEFSKKIVDRTTLICVIITIYTMAYSWVTKDSTPLIYLIPAWFVELGIINGFYLNKAKEENVIKIANNKEVEINEHTDI